MATLSIVIEDNLLKRLREHIPARKISKFINEIITEKIADKEILLQQEYKQAEIIYANNDELDDWNKLDNHDW